MWTGYRPLMLLLGLLLVGTVACTTTAVPTQNLRSSAAVIGAATEEGAPSVPDANVYLKLANDQTDVAQDLIQQGPNHRAAYVLARAEADADLALVLARENQVRLE